MRGSWKGLPRNLLFLAPISQLAQALQVGPQSLFNLAKVFAIPSDPLNGLSHFALQITQRLLAHGQKSNVRSQRRLYGQFRNLPRLLVRRGLGRGGLL